jgi:DNA repair protein RadC
MEKQKAATATLSPVQVSQFTRYAVKTFTVQLALRENPKGDVLNSPNKAREVARAILATLDADQEHFVVLMLNVQNELIGYKNVSSGTIDQVAVYPRIILRNAILMCAAGIIIVHNHPSGHVDPSEEDKRMTKTVKETGKNLDVRLLDHLIIDQSSDACFSFLEGGLI